MTSILVQLTLQYLIMIKIPIHYVKTQEEAQVIRAEYKKHNQKVHIIISGNESIKNNLKDFIKARAT